MARRKSRSYSRLARHEKKRLKRQTTVYTILTVLLMIALIFWGIPSLIKVALFLGEIRSSSQPISREDKIPPSPPVIQPIPAATNSATVRIKGFAEEGATVVLSLNKNKVQEAVVESDGQFLFDNVRLQSGENRFNVQATDTSGNESNPSSTLVVEHDNAAPILILEGPANGSNFFGAGEKNIKVVGSTDPGSSVLVNGSFVILASNGSFSKTVALTTGENEILIVSRDKAGNSTEETVKVNYEE